ncbi:MAG: hypothetical protein AAF721_17375 [Myxococcota bacterium]
MNTNATNRSRFLSLALFAGLAVACDQQGGPDAEEYDALVAAGADPDSDGIESLIEADAITAADIPALYGESVTRSWNADAVTAQDVPLHGESITRSWNATHINTDDIAECPDPEAAGVTQVGDDPQECAGISVSCLPGWVNIATACGCGCVREGFEAMKNLPLEFSGDGDSAPSSGGPDQLQAPGTVVVDPPCLGHCPQRQLTSAP